MTTFVDLRDAVQGRMAFEAAWERHKMHWNRPMPPDEQEFRHGWNAAVAAAEAIVEQAHDPNEPWLDPGALTRALEVEVQT